MRDRIALARGVEAELRSRLARPLIAVLDCPWIPDLSAPAYPRVLVLAHSRSELPPAIIAKVGLRPGHAFVSVAGRIRPEAESWTTITPPVYLELLYEDPRFPDLIYQILEQYLPMRAAQG